MSLNYLSRVTGFPPETLKTFVEAGLLPKGAIGHNDSYDGLALLKSLEEEIYCE